MSDITGAVQEKLARDFREVVADVEDLLRLTAEEAGEQAVELRDRIQQKLHFARVRLQRLEDTTATRAREAIESSDRYARSHPWGTAGVAAAAGLLIGLLLSRR